MTKFLMFTVMIISIGMLVFCSKVPEIMDYEKVDVKPTPVNLAEPTYPEALKTAGIQGETVVRALIETDGSIKTAEISGSSGNALLDTTALTAVLISSFKPARHKGHAVKVWVNIPIKFVLKNK